MSDEQAGKIYIEGHYDIPLDQLEAITAAMLENITLTRQEPGNEKLDYRIDEKVQGRVHLSEIFTNQAALDAHMVRVSNSPWATISKVVVKSFQVRTGKA